MSLPSRHMLIGMTLGAVSAMALAAVGPGMVIETFADGIVNAGAAPAFDSSKLVKFEGSDYQIQAEDWVSQEPISSQRIKKIEAGRVSYVTIATTATGTYSSDAMFSKNVQYPGIDVSEVPSAGNPFSALNGRKWFSFSSRNGHSFFDMSSGDVRITSWGKTTCVSGKGFRIC
jgi:hypothetical protein